ncbi:hypothetical protein BDC45DRAFT_576994 [Circinella umbellata]|nr:hypothetical protein BDC45DRAFT_576994 [Circinella umbellata]
MDDNFDDFTERYSSTPAPAQEVPGRNTLGSIENGARAFNGSSTLWSEMVEMQGGVINTVNKRNADLEQEVHELKNQIDKSMKKKSCSPRENVLSCFMRNHYKRKMIPEGAVWNFEYAYNDEENLGVRRGIINYTKKASDDLGYRWADELIEEKLIVVYKNAKYTSSLIPESRVLSRLIWIGLAPFRIRSVLKRIGFSEIRIVHGLENCNPNPFRKNPD